MADSEYLKSDEDVEAILRLAIREESSSTGDLRQRLKDAAGELGISEEQLAAAEKKYKAERETKEIKAFAEQDEKQQWIEFRRSQVHDFWRSLLSYIAVNAGLVAMNIFTSGHITWAWWCIAGWGIGIAMQLAKTLSAYSQENQTEFDRWRRKKAKRAMRLARVQSGQDAYSDDDMEETAIDLIHEGNKIEAIKIVREKTGMGLKDAKEYVELLEMKDKG